MKRKILVCITPQSNSKRLIDKGSNSIFNIDDELYILHVTKGSNLLLDPESIDLIQKLFTYASSLGGIVQGLCGEDIYKTIKKFIVENMITHVVVGTPKGQLPNEETIIDKLKRELPYINLVVV